MDAADKRIKLQERIELLEEKKRRDRQKRDIYSPNEGQLKVHHSDKKVRMVIAGNGAGKSTMAVQEAVWAAKGYSPITKKHTAVPARVIIVTDRPSKIGDLYLSAFNQWFDTSTWKFNKRGKTFIEQIVFPNGSEIIFMTHDQDQLAFESIELDFAIWDEPAPKFTYTGLRRGGRKKGHPARYLLIGTPITGSWLRTDIYNPWVKGELPDTECFKFSSYINEKNLDTGALQSLESALTEKERRVRIHGEFFDLEGLALAHLFKRETHVVAMPPFPKDAPCVVSIDFHPSKAHVACILGVDEDDQLYYLKEMRSRAVPTQLAEELKEFYKDYNVIDIVCDSLGNSELTGGINNHSFIEVLRMNGVPTRATSRSDKKEETWLAKIQDVLRIPVIPDNLGRIKPRLLINEECRGLIHDIENVEWLKIKNEELFKPSLDIKNKDYLAVLKYALASNLCYNKGREPIIGAGGPVSPHQRYFGTEQTKVWYNRNHGRGDE